MYNTDASTGAKIRTCRRGALVCGDGDTRRETPEHTHATQDTSSNGYTEGHGERGKGRHLCTATLADAQMVVRK